MLHDGVESRVRPDVRHHDRPAFPADPAGDPLPYRETDLPGAFSFDHPGPDLAPEVIDEIERGALCVQGPAGAGHDSTQDLVILEGGGDDPPDLQDRIEALLLA